MLVLLHLPPAPGSADTIYHWMDTAGVAHFSDTQPPDPPAERAEFELAPPQHQAVQGLRPGEQASLQALEQRLENQHRSAQRARQRGSHALAERRRDCRERRARQRRTGNHPMRKELTTYLRRNCW